MLTKIPLVYFYMKGKFAPHFDFHCKLWKKHAIFDPKQMLLIWNEELSVLLKLIGSVLTIWAAIFFFLGQFFKNFSFWGYRRIIVKKFICSRNFDRLWPLRFFSRPKFAQIIPVFVSTQRPHFCFRCAWNSLNFWDFFHRQSMSVFDSHTEC